MYWHVHNRVQDGMWQTALHVSVLAATMFSERLPCLQGTVWQADVQDSVSVRCTELQRHLRDTCMHLVVQETIGLSKTILHIDM